MSWPRRALRSEGRHRQQVLAVEEDLTRDPRPRVEQSHDRERRDRLAAADSPTRAIVSPGRTVNDTVVDHVDVTMTGGTDRQIAHLQQGAQRRSGRASARRARVLVRAGSSSRRSSAAVAAREGAAVTLSSSGSTGCASTSSGPGASAFSRSVVASSVEAASAVILRALGETMASVSPSDTMLRHSTVSMIRMRGRTSPTTRPHQQVAAGGDHVAPRGFGIGHARLQETTASLEDDRVGHEDGREHEHGRQGVAGDVLDDDCGASRTDHADGRHVVLAVWSRMLARHDAGQLRERTGRRS